MEFIFDLHGILDITFEATDDYVLIDNIIR